MLFTELDGNSFVEVRQINNYSFCFKVSTYLYHRKCLYCNSGFKCTRSKEKFSVQNNSGTKRISRRSEYTDEYFKY